MVSNWGLGFMCDLWIWVLMHTLFPKSFLWTLAINFWIFFLSHKQITIANSTSVLMFQIQGFATMVLFLLASNLLIVEILAINNGVVSVLYISEYWFLIYLSDSAFTLLHKLNCNNQFVCRHDNESEEPRNNNYLGFTSKHG